jgi:pimeloyl-ACP methyl ester carboxylesterase
MGLRDHVARVVDRAALAIHKSKRDAFDEELLQEANAHYRGAFQFCWGDALSLRQEKSALTGGIHETSFTFASSFDPSAPERMRARYLSHRTNLTGHVRTYSRRTPSKTACIFLHGYLGGFYPWEARKFPCVEFAQAGVDVALPLLPFHGFRADTMPPFPSVHPFYTVEGYRQAIFELHGLVLWLRARGAERVAVAGISLGANIACLYATLQEPTLLGAITPLADLGNVAQEPSAESDSEQPLVRAILSHVSPLTRAPKLRGDRVHVIGGALDAVTPMWHAEALAKHFDTTVCVIPGAHIVATGRRDAFRTMLQRLLQ